MKKSTLFIITLFLVYANLNAQNIFQLKEINLPKNTELSKKIVDYQIVEFDDQALFELRQKNDNQLSFELKIGTHKARAFNLQAKEIRSDDYILQTKEQGQLKSLEKNKTPLFQGELTGEDYGSAIFTIDENFIVGFWQEDGVRLYLEPLWRLEPSADRNQYVFYQEKDAVIPEDFCGVTDETIAAHRKKHQHAPAQEKLVGECLVVEIALAADFDMFQAFGSVASVESFMFGALADVQTNYDNEFDDELRFEVVTTFVATSNASDPWTNSNNAGNLLDDFTDWGNGGGFGAVNYDVAAIWTDRNFTGSTIGVAWLGSICTGLRYHALERFTTNAVTTRVLWAHELGHNFDASHDSAGSNFIMAPSVNTSTTWSTASQNSINSFIPSRSCLTANCGGGGGGGTEPPTADFTASDFTGCAPFEVQFTDQSLDDPEFWEWTFEGGDPGFSTDQNPIVTYNSAGTFDVSLFVSNDNGSDEYTEIGLITVMEGPIADFNVDVNGFDVDFTNFSIGGDNYDWDFGDGSFSSDFAPFHTYNEPGEYEVTLTVSNDCGIATISIIVVIESSLVANFDAAPTMGCAPLEVNFSDTSEGNPSYWEWMLPGGDPATSNSSNPFITYYDAGSYDVSLTLGNNNEEDMITMEGFIVVLPDPVADFSVNIESGSNTPTITNNSENANTYHWDFGDGQMSGDEDPSHTYESTGEYTITLTVTNSCGTAMTSHTIMLTAPVDPSFTSSDTQGCLPHTVTFEAAPQEDGNSYEWIFEGGNPATSSSPNPTVIYETEGNFDVSLMITNEAGAGTELQENAILINGLPQAAFMFSNTPGEGTVTFTNQSSNTDTYLWDFGDESTDTSANTNHEYTSEGTYLVSLISTNECGSDTSTMEVTIVFVPEPAISVSTSTTCIPSSVSYQANPVAEGNTYFWSFPGGQPATSTDANPSVSYETPGAYDATLTVTNSAGEASMTEENIIIVNNGPEADFMLADYDGEGTLGFSNQSTNAVSYQWDFGDDTSSTLENPTHTYEAEGIYNVTLTTTNECGTDVKSIEVVIVFLPEPGISIANTTSCTGMAVSYQASPVADGHTYLWSFPGGQPASSTEANPSIVYENTGTYDATLTVTNLAGEATTTSEHILVVNNSPTTDFIITNNSSDGMVTFANQSTNATTYSWDFGDESSSMIENPSHTYTAEGTYTVVLTSTNECGSDTQSMEVVILFPPQPSISIASTTSCAGQTVSYQAAPVADGHTYLWSFPGGEPTSSTEANPSVVYNNAGSYDASLTVTNTAGSTTVSTDNILVVNSAPEADFTSSNTLGEGLVAFTNLSNNADSWEWDFGDENSSNEENPTHTYTNAGTYMVTLTVNNECGSHIHSTEVMILFVPDANITVSAVEACAPAQIDFQAMPMEDGNTYEWSFSGGSISQSENANETVLFSTAGTYTATLTVTNAAGSNTSTQEINILALPNADFSHEINGLTATFSNNSNNATAYSWTINGMMTSETSPTVTFAGVGMYEVQLIAENLCGSDEFTTTINIEGQIPAISFTAENNQGCGPLEVSFVSQIEDADEFTWSFEGGSPATSTDLNPTVVYNEPGVYTATLTANNAFGTNAFSLQNIVIVNELTTADFTYQAEGATVEFSNQSSHANTIGWLFPDGSTSFEETTSFTFPGNGEYNVSLAAEGLCNTDTETQTITINGALPVIEIITDKQEGCLPFTVNFSDASSAMPTSRQWMFPGGDPATSTDQNVMVTYSTVGNYDVSLTVSNEFGSSQQDWENFISVLDVPATPNFTINTLDNTSGELAVVDPLSGLTYNWDLGNGTLVNGENVSYNYTEEGVYTVSLTAMNDCGEATSSQDITIIINSLSTPNWVSNLSLFPNPTKGQVNLRAIGWPTKGKMNLSLVNVLGQHIEQKQFEVLGGEWNHAFNWDYLPAGTYMLQFEWKSEVWSQKVIKF